MMGQGGGGGSIEQTVQTARMMRIPPTAEAGSRCRAVWPSRERLELFLDGRTFPPDHEES